MRSARNMIIALFVAACVMAPRSECAVPEGAVAVVNGQLILRADFGRALVRTLGPAALDSLVDFALVEQEARKRNITVTDEEIDARRKLHVELRLCKIFEEARMSPEEYHRAAKKHGGDEETLRKELSESISTEHLRIRLLTERLLRPYLTITDEHVKRYYDSTRGERYAAAHIALTSEKAARALKDKLAAKPEAWPGAVLNWSLDRGSVPYKGRMRPVPTSSRLGKAMQDMKTGELKLYQDGQLWHVLRFISRIPATGRPFEEVRDEVKRILYARRAEETTDMWLAQLNGSAEVVTNLSPDLAVREVLGAETAMFVRGTSVPFSRLGDVLVELFGRDFIGPYIERRLIFQQARSAGLTVSEKALNDRLADLGEALFAEHAAEWRMSSDKFSAFLFAQGMPAERYKQQLVRELVVREDVRAGLLAEQMAMKGADVSDEDVQRVYRDYHREQIDAKRITVDNLVTAENVYKNAQRGANFDLLLQTESTEPLAWLHRGLVIGITADAPYFSVLKNLRVGGVSQVFRYRSKYHIMKVLDRHPPKEVRPLEAVREAVTEQARAQKVRGRAKAWLEKVRAEARIEIRFK